MLKFREIIIRPDVKLPPVSTDRPARPYSFVDFLVEWGVGARELRKDEILPHLFELEEAVEELTDRLQFADPRITRLFIRPGRAV